MDTTNDGARATLVDSMSVEQLREEVRRLSHAIVNADRSREDRSGMPMIGGADVCTTCSAHCNVMDDDEAELKRLQAENRSFRDYLYEYGPRCRDCGVTAEASVRAPKFRCNDCTAKAEARFRAPQTNHERKAIALAQRILGRTVHYKIAIPQYGFIYDWADPATGEMGQCWMNKGGAWAQDPRGENPVVLYSDDHPKSVPR